MEKAIGIVQYFKADGLASGGIGDGEAAEIARNGADG